MASAHTAISIGPLHIHAIDSQELTRRLIADALAVPATHHVVTANAQFYNLAEQSADFRRCVAQAEYVCADGVSMVMACKWLRHREVARVPGVELMERLCAQSVSSGLWPYFLGGKEGSAQMAVENLSRKYPGFKAAGICCPPVGFERTESSLRPVLEDIERARPAIVFVALGAPLQELFIHSHIRPLRVPVAIGVGGSFEMIAGRVRRAPRWVQRVGCEWAYRWAQEPRRLTRRYLVGNTQFCFYVLRYMLRGDRS